MYSVSSDAVARHCVGLKSAFYVAPLGETSAVLDASALDVSANDSLHFKLSLLGNGCVLHIAEGTIAIHGSVYFNFSYKDSAITNVVYNANDRTVEITSSDNIYECYLAVSRTTEWVTCP